MSSYHAELLSDSLILHLTREGISPWTLLDTATAVVRSLCMQEPSKVWDLRRPSYRATLVWLSASTVGGFPFETYFTPRNPAATPGSGTADGTSIPGYESRASYQCWRSRSGCPFWMAIFPIFWRAWSDFCFPDFRFWIEIDIERSKIAIISSISRCFTRSVTRYAQRTIAVTVSGFVYSCIVDATALLVPLGSYEQLYTIRTCGQHVVVDVVTLIHLHKS